MSPPTPDLHSLRCRNHGEREAVARCGTCQGFFCRECIVEHEGQMTCSTCLQEMAAEPPRPRPPRRWLRPVTFVLGWGLGLLTSWLFFMLIGRILLLFKQGMGWMEAL